MRPIKIVFVGLVGVVGLVGTVKNGLELFHGLYFWSLMRFVGYGALFGWALLKLWQARYNTGSVPEEGKR